MERINQQVINSVFRKGVRHDPERYANYRDLTQPYSWSWYYWDRMVEATRGGA